jgi:hypothetical protein
VGRQSDRGGRSTPNAEAPWRLQAAQQGAPPPEKWKNVPQLVQELEEKLARGEVECMICYDQVRGLVVHLFSLKPAKRA